MKPMPRTCVVCGGRGAGGTNRCELHPAPPAPTERDRLQSKPWRRHYGTAEYRRNRLVAFGRSGGRCADCGDPIAVDTGECDHIVALADGGGDAVDNLTWRCLKCHEAKTRDDCAKRRRSR